MLIISYLNFYAIQDPSEIKGFTAFIFVFYMENKAFGTL